MTPDWMPPPLPEHAAFACDKFGEGLGCLFTTEQMHAYAIAAVESYKSSLKPHAYERQYWHNGKLKLRELSYHPITASPDKAVPLYRIDGGDDDAA